MFVTPQDFDRPEYAIPNLNKVVNTFNDFIQRREEKVLRCLLGNDLYQQFIDGLDEVPIPATWILLRDGGSYPLDEKVYNWVGMKEMLIPYIYSRWLKYSFATFNGVGVTFPKTENAEVVKPYYNIVRANNDFARIVGNECYQQNTLYGFLKVTAYSGWEFKEPERYNLLGI